MALVPLDAPAFGGVHSSDAASVCAGDGARQPLGRRRADGVQTVRAGVQDDARDARSRCDATHGPLQGPALVANQRRLFDHTILQSK